MSKTSKTLSVLLFLITFAATPSLAQVTQDKTEAPPQMTVISDAPHGSPVFVQFVYFFNQALIQWWQKGGRANVKGKWTVSLSENYDEELRPRGITMIIARSSIPPRRIMLNRQPITTGRAGALAAVDVVITVIQTTAEEDQK